MLARSLVLILLSVLLTGRVASAAQPAGIAGAWEGRLVLGDAGLRLVFNFTAAAKGALTGTMDSPDHGAYGIGHCTKVHGDVRGLRDHGAAGVEQRARGIAPFSNVR